MFYRLAQIGIVVLLALLLTMRTSIFSGLIRAVSELLHRATS